MNFGLIITAAVLLFFWFVERALFWPMTGLAVLVLLTTHIRTRKSRRAGSGLIEKIGAVLGRKVTGKKIVLSVASGELALSEIDPAHFGKTAMLAIASDVGLACPFCFVMRPAARPVAGDTLVENTPIPDIDFEYSLARQEALDGWECASNMPSLMLEFLLDPEVMANLAVLQGSAEPRLQEFLFDGRELRSLWLPADTMQEHNLRRILARLVLLSTDLGELLSGVHFKTPYLPRRRTAR